MKLVELSVSEFINEVDSNSPAPGGGSVAALAGSIGSALCRMVGHLSVKKKKFKALDVDVRNEFNTSLEEILIIKEELSKLVDKDTEAFNLIMGAFKLPKETDEEKVLRSKAIEDATVVAIEVPLEVAKLCRNAMDHLVIIKKNGNKNCLSDLGVSMLMLNTGLMGAIMNVKINIPGLSNENQINKYNASINDLLTNTETLVSTFTKEILVSL